MKGFLTRWVLWLLCIGVLWGCVLQDEERARVVGDAGQLEVEPAIEAEPTIEAEPADESTCPSLGSRGILDVGDNCGVGGPELIVAGVWERPMPRFTGEVIVARALEGALELTAEGFSATLHSNEALALSRRLSDGATAWLDVIAQAHGFGGGETVWVLRDEMGSLLAASIFTNNLQLPAKTESERLIFGAAEELDIEVLERTCDPLPAYCFSYSLAHEVRVRLGEATTALFSGQREVEALGARFIVRVNEASTGIDDERGHQCADDPRSALQMSVYHVAQ